MNAPQSRTAALMSDRFPSMPRYVRNGTRNRAYDGAYHHWMGGSVSLTQCRTYAVAKMYGFCQPRFNLRSLRPYRSRYDQMARDFVALRLRLMRYDLRHFGEVQP